MTACAQVTSSKRSSEELSRALVPVQIFRAESRRRAMCSLDAEKYL